MDVSYYAAGNDAIKTEIKARNREQEKDDAKIVLGLEEKIQELEKSIKEKELTYQHNKDRYLSEINKYKATIEASDSLIFQCNEKLRTLEYDKKSGVVILAAKERIIERCHQELALLDEKLLNEKRINTELKNDKNKMALVIADEQEKCSKLLGDINTLNEEVQKKNDELLQLGAVIKEIKKDHKDAQDRYVSYNNYEKNFTVF
jgi:chromosome segregation ATPase